MIYLLRIVLINLKSNGVRRTNVPGTTSEISRISKASTSWYTERGLAILNSFKTLSNCQHPFDLL